MFGRFFWCPKGECDVKSELSTKVKLETFLKNEGMYETYLGGCKHELKGEVKDEVKHEAGVKCEVKSEVKSEGAQEDEAAGSTGKLMRRLRRKTTVLNEQVAARIKKEVGIKLELTGCIERGVVRTLAHQLLTVDSSYAARVPLWIKQCVDHQEAKKTWSPYKPCCLPNCWISPRAAPNRENLEPCFLKLSKSQRRQFREFVESDEVENITLPRCAFQRWHNYLHPEARSTDSTKSAVWNSANGMPGVPGGSWVGSWGFLGFPEGF